MLCKTQALVLTSIKYGDSGKISRVYTEAFGLRSLISKGLYTKKNKQNSLLLPFSQLELVLDEKQSHRLGYFREAKQLYHYTSLFVDPIKSAIALFLCEILCSVLVEEEPHSELFYFLSNSFKEFDNKNTAYSDFHLWFLLHLTKYLGFYPHLEKNSSYFDLASGTSEKTQPIDSAITGEELLLFEKLYLMDFVKAEFNIFTQQQRLSLLSILLNYYELHASGFRTPKSFDVLNQVFG